jgi:hypothetical protein
MKSNISLNSSDQAFAYGVNSSSIDMLTGLPYIKGFAVSLVATVTTPTPKTFTAAVTDIVTVVGHGYLTGLVLRGTTTGTLPAGLALATDYFVIYIDADTFKLASSLVNAIAGTAVDITGTGTGTHTLTATALAGGSYKLQASTDNSAWNDLAAATNITANSNFLVQVVDPMYQYLRIVYTLTAGQLSISQKVYITGV